jgi:hypothetical protein
MCLVFPRFRGYGDEVDFAAPAARAGDDFDALPVKADGL